MKFGRDNHKPSQLLENTRLWKCKKIEQFYFWKYTYISHRHKYIIIHDLLEIWVFCGKSETIRGNAILKIPLIVIVKMNWIWKNTQKYWVYDERDREKCIGRIVLHNNLETGLLTSRNVISLKKSNVIKYIHFMLRKSNIFCNWGLRSHTSQFYENIYRYLTLSKSLLRMPIQKIFDVIIKINKYI